jgi:hypothetical protein
MINRCECGRPLDETPSKKEAAAILRAAAFELENNAIGNDQGYGYAIISLLNIANLFEADSDSLMSVKNFIKNSNKSVKDPEGND